MVRMSSPAPTSSASVSAVWPIVTARSSRRSPRPALLFGPALLSTSIGSRREARNAGKKPATSAPTIAGRARRPAPASRSVTASSRGIAWPADHLEDLDDPERESRRRARRRAKPAAGSRSRPGGRARAGRRRARCARRILLTLQSAHQQQRRDVAAGDQQHQRRGAEQRQQDAAAIAIHIVGERLHLRGEPVEVAIGLAPAVDVTTRSSALRLFERRRRPQPPDDVPDRCFQPLRVQAAGVQKSTVALTL